MVPLVACSSYTRNYLDSDCDCLDCGTDERLVHICCASQGACAARTPVASDPREYPGGEPMVSALALWEECACAECAHHGVASGGEAPPHGARKLCGPVGGFGAGAD